MILRIRKDRRLGCAVDAGANFANSAFFVERDAESAESEVASAASIAQVKTEITGLRSEIAALSRQKDY